MFVPDVNLFDLYCIVRLFDLGYPYTMRILYKYNRPAPDASNLNADKVFADDETTRRISRGVLIDSDGLREGDTLLRYDLGDLGKPKEAKRLVGLIEAMGVAVEVNPMPKPPRPPRKVWLSPTDKQRDDICTLWYSSIGPSAVLSGAEQIMGRPVSRQQLDRLCGKRDGSSKKF